MERSTSPLQSGVTAPDKAPDLNDPATQWRIYEAIRDAYLSAEPEPEAEL